MATHPQPKGQAPRNASCVAWRTLHREPLAPNCLRQTTTSSAGFLSQPAFAASRLSTGSTGRTFTGVLLYNS